MKQFSNKYGLEERTAVFGEDILKFCRGFNKTNINSIPLINQLIRSATSVGANYIDTFIEN